MLRKLLRTRIPPVQPLLIHRAIHSHNRPTRPPHFRMTDKVLPNEAGLYLDSPTGEMVSKSELKRRAKLREKEAKKAAEKVCVSFSSK
jgi:hypothetical protein